jgi:hypothetical protein
MSRFLKPFPLHLYFKQFWVKKKAAGSPKGPAAVFIDHTISPVRSGQPIVAERYHRLLIETVVADFKLCLTIHGQALLVADKSLNGLVLVPEIQATGYREAVFLGL